MLDLCLTVVFICIALMSDCVCGCACTRVCMCVEGAICISSFVKFLFNSLTYPSTEFACISLIKLSALKRCVCINSGYESVVS